MLPECDTLAEILVALVNGHIQSETEPLQHSCYQNIKELLEKDSRKSEHCLLPLLCKQEGFCADVVMGLSLCEWSTRKLHSEYLTEIAKKDVCSKVAVVLKFSQLKINKNLNLSEILLKLFENNTGNLYEWIKADSLLGQDPLSEQLRETVVKPAIAESVTDVFNLRLNDNGIEILSKYLKANTDIEKNENYVVVKAFLKLKKALKSGDAKPFFKALSVLVKDENKLNIADYVEQKLQSEAESSQQKILFDIAVSSLRKISFFQKISISRSRIFIQLRCSQRQDRKQMLPRSQGKRPKPPPRKFSKPFLWEHQPTKFSPNKQKTVFPLLKSSFIPLSEVIPRVRISLS